MTQVFFDLYGFETDAIDSLIEPLEKTLQVDFVARTSGYWGDYYSYKGQDNQEYKLQPNIDEEDEVIEKSFPNMKLLFRVTETQRADVIKELLTENIQGINFLRRKIIDL